jgi:HK97 family phage portal protein
MSLFSRAKPLASVVEEDRSLKPIEFPALSSELPITTEPITDVDQYNALRVADAYACIRLLSDAVASLPVRAYRDTPQGRVAAGPDSRVQRLLDRPSPGSTSCDLFSQIMVHLNVAGDCFIGKFRGADGEIVQLALIDPRTVQVELHGQNIVYRVFLSGQDSTTFGPADILHVKSMTGIDGMRGLSPVTQARRALELSANLQESSRQYFYNGSKPSGILTVKGPQNDFTVKQIKDQWDTRHTGTLNMHRIAVLAGEATFTPVSFSAEDSQFLQQRELSAREVCRVFRVPPHMLGCETANARTYSNVTQSNLEFIQHSLRPWLTRIERAFTADADLCMGQLYLSFDLDGLLRGDPDLRTQIYQRALGSPAGGPAWMTVDEVRALEDLPPMGEQPVLPPAEPAKPAPAPLPVGAIQ